MQWTKQKSQTVVISLKRTRPPKSRFHSAYKSWKNVIIRRSVFDLQPTLSESVEATIFSVSLTRRKSPHVGSVTQSNLFQKLSC